MPTMQQQMQQRAATPVTKSAQSPSPKAQVPIRRRAKLHSVRRSLTKERPLPVPEVQQSGAGSGHPGLCRLGASASPPPVCDLQLVKLTVSVDVPPYQKGMGPSEGSPTLSSKTCTAQANGSRSTSAAPYEDPANDPRQYRRRGRRPKLTRALETSSYTQCTADQALLQQHDGGKNMSPSSVHAQDSPGVWLCVYQPQPGQGVAQVYMHDQALTQDTWEGMQPSNRLQPIMTVDHKLSFLRCTEKHGPWHNYYIQFDGDGGLLEEDIMFPNRVVLLEKRPAVPQPPPLQQYTISSWALPSAGAAANRLASLFQSPTAHPQQTQQSGFGTHTSSGQQHRALQRTPSPSLQQLSASLSHMLNRDTNTKKQVKASTSTRKTASPMPTLSSSDDSSMWTVQRSKHDYRGIHDIVLWLADPTDASIRAHLVNLIRCGMCDTPTNSRQDSLSDWEPPSNKNIKPEWVYTRLVATWGRAALLDLKFTRNAVARLTREAGLLLGTMALTHSPSPPRLQLHYRESIDMQLAAHARLHSVGG